MKTKRITPATPATFPIPAAIFEPLEPRQLLANVAPTLTAFDIVPFAIAGLNSPLDYQTLRDSSDAADADADPISFVIRSVLNGTLEKDNLPIVPGVTTLGTGQTLVWQPSDEARGVVNAFVVRAFDGFDDSGWDIVVPVYTAGPSFFDANYFDNLPWELSGLDFSGDLVIDGPSGQVTGTIDDADGNNTNLAGTTFEIVPDGVTFFENIPPAVGFTDGAGGLSNTGDFIAFNPNLPVAGASDARLALMVLNNADDFDNADLNGSWDFVSPLLRGTIRFNGAGVVLSGSGVTGDGSPFSISRSTYSVAQDGTVQMNLIVPGSDNGSFDLTGAINNSGDLLIVNYSDLTADPDEQGLALFLRRGTVFNNSLLRGTWLLNGQFNSGFLSFDGNGRITGGLATDDEGTEFTVTAGTYKIATSGSVTVDVVVREEPSGQSATFNYVGSVNASGNVVALTRSRLPVDGNRNNDFTDMMVLTDTANRAPTLSKINPFTGLRNATVAEESTDFPFTFEELLALSDARDESPDLQGLSDSALRFKIVDLLSGTLKINAVDAQPGDVILPGDNLTWNPGVVGAKGLINAFSVVATDQALDSATPVVVKINTAQDPRATVVSVTPTDKTAAETTAPVAANLGKFTIARTGPTTNPLTVDFNLAGSAANPADYAITAVQNGVVTPLVGSVVIPAGAASILITVTPVDDANVEGTENVVLTLTPDASYGINATKSAAAIDILDNEKDTVSILAPDPDAAESGNPAFNTGMYVVSRTAPGNNPLKVALTRTGTAAPADFKLALDTPAGKLITGGDVTIPAGQTSVTFYLLPVDDATAEAAETATFTIKTSRDYDIDGGANAATVTIADNEPIVRLDIVTDTRDEPDSDVADRVAAFTLTRSAPSIASALKVNITRTGTAKTNSDYKLFDSLAPNAKPIADTITIPAGQLAVTLYINTVNDTTFEPTETATFTIKPATTYTADPNAATGDITINDDETILAVQAPDLTLDEEAEEVVEFNISAVNGIASYTNATGLVLPFKVTGTAKRGTDYILRDPTTGNTITGNNFLIPTGQTSVTVELKALNDTLADSGETVRIELLNTTKFGYQDPRVFDFTIIDDEPKVAVTITNPDLTETAGNPNNYATVRFTPSTPFAVNTRVNFTVGGTAKRGTDYLIKVNSPTDITLLSTGITFTPGQQFIDFYLVPLDDNTTEGLENVVITAVGSTAYSPDPNNPSVTAQITDDEPVVSITKTKDASETSPTTTGKGSFKVTRTGATNQPLTVNYQVAGGSTATSGTDYSSLSGTVVIPAGKSFVNIDVTPAGDGDIEGTETVIVNLLANAAYTLSATATTATVNIADGPVDFQALFGSLTFTQTTYTDLRAPTPAGLVGQITSGGTFVSTNGRNGGYFYTTSYGPGQSKNAVFTQLVFDGQPTLNVGGSIQLVWTTTRLDSLDGKTISWPASSTGRSGTFQAFAVIYGVTDFDTSGNFKVV